MLGAMEVESGGVTDGNPGCSNHSCMTLGKSFTLASCFLTCVDNIIFHSHKLLQKVNEVCGKTL